MHAELPILSFICVALLLALAPLHWKSRNVAVLSLIGWLVICNVLQGLNSILWAGNTNIKVPVWCDIATKLRLGGQLASSASSACICWHLYFLSSSRDGKRRNYRSIVESVLCILCPLIYMALHVIVQDHRFNLIQDFGCSVSIYPSIPAVILVWTLPLIFCSITYVFTLLALWSHFRDERSRVTTSTITFAFIRPLLASVIIVSVILFATIFSISAHMISTGHLLHWSSLSEVHARISVVNVLSEPSRFDLARIAVEWWAIPTVSLTFVLQSIIGLFYGPRSDDSMVGLRTVGRWVNRRVFSKSVGMESFITSSGDFKRSVTLKSPPTPTPVHLLKSGWDNTLRSNDPFAKAKTKPRPPPIAIHNPIIPSPASSSSSEADSDNSFLASTLTYLQSPPGPPALKLPPQATTKSSIMSSRPPPPSQSARRLAVPVQQHISESPASVTESILSAPWPEPPTSIPLPDRSPSTISIPSIPSPGSVYSQSSSRAVHHLSTSSNPGSIASSTISTHGYAVYDPALPPPTPHTAPFEDAGIPTEVPIPVVPTTPRRLKKMGSKDTLSGKNLVHGLSIKSRDRERVDANAVYMTVVHETV